MANPSVSESLLPRAAKGAFEGANWGGVLGLTHGLVHVLHNSNSLHWFLQLGGSLLAGLILGSILCCIGRAVSGKLLGACLGAILGLFAGFMLGELVGASHWTVIEQAHGQVTSTGIPVGQILGSGLGALAGAMLGATVDRLVRRSTGPVIPSLA